MDQSHSYDLSFVAPQRRPHSAPEIVFIIDERHLPEVIDRLRVIIKNCASYADAYLGTSAVDFTLPGTDLFGNKEFGYHNCGYWTQRDGKVRFHLQLRPFPWTHYCSLTMFLLTRALDFPFEQEPASNQTQHVQLTTMSEIGRSGGYGHAVGGHISEDVLDWLKRYAKDLSTGPNVHQSAPLPPEVLTALRSTWHNIAGEKIKQYVRPNDIYGWVRETGAFSMICFGDACDLSIYPDQWLDTGCQTVEFSCHNLDSAEQQLTLVAGFAKLCQLARDGA